MHEPGFSHWTTSPSIYWRTGKTSWLHQETAWLISKNFAFCSLISMLITPHQNWSENKSRRGGSSFSQLAKIIAWYWSQSSWASVKRRGSSKSPRVENIEPFNDNESGKEQQVWELENHQVMMCLLSRNQIHQKKPQMHWHHQGLLQNKQKKNIPKSFFL